MNNYPRSQRRIVNYSSLLQSQMVLVELLTDQSVFLGKPQERVQSIRLFETHVFQYFDTYRKAKMNAEHILIRKTVEVGMIAIWATFVWMLMLL